MKTIAIGEPLAGVLALACALAVFVAAALDAGDGPAAPAAPAHDAGTSTTSAAPAR